MLDRSELQNHVPTITSSSSEAVHIDLDRTSLLIVPGKKGIHTEPTTTTMAARAPHRSCQAITFVARDISAGTASKLGRDVCSRTDTGLSE